MSKSFFSRKITSSYIFSINSMYQDLLSNDIKYLKNTYENYSFIAYQNSHVVPSLQGVTNRRHAHFAPSLLSLTSWEFLVCPLPSSSIGFADWSKEEEGGHPSFVVDCGCCWQVLPEVPRLVPRWEAKVGSLVASFIDYHCFLLSI
jgi:hypothetical protein